jgi:tRNA nucleotidyltransferase (CCA-adding enzyme)
MARAENGALIDPFGGERDLRAGVLRHVGPAFAEDPLRVLRVARFAARFGFVVAPETEALMRSIAASEELATLSPERIWQELSRALMERAPSRFIMTLRRSGALASVLPEIDALFGRTRRTRSVAARVLRAVDAAAAANEALPVRYAVVAAALGEGTRARVFRSDRLSARVNAPTDCRDLARLAARYGERVERASRLSATQLLDLLLATDALRRPERLEGLVRVCAAWRRAGRPFTGQYPPGGALAAALDVVQSIDAGKIALAKTSGREIGRRLRAERLKALRLSRRRR